MILTNTAVGSAAAHVCVCEPVTDMDDLKLGTSDSSTVILWYVFYMQRSWNTPPPPLFMYSHRCMHLSLCDTNTCHLSPTAQRSSSASLSFVPLLSVLHTLTDHRVLRAVPEQISSAVSDPAGHSKFSCSGPVPGLLGQACLIASRPDWSEEAHEEIIRAGFT